MSFAPLPPPLPAELLALRTSLPLKPAAITLAGQTVQLTPLVLERDLEALFARSNGAPDALGERTMTTYDADELIWRYLFSGPFTDLAAFAAYVQPQVAATNGLCMCVVDQATGQPIGMTNFMNNSPENLKIELGGIWYSPLVQRTHTNTEATYLMLQHAFTLGYQRLEWKCNALNERSRRAALRMGFQFEGIQDSHLVIKDRNRDTAWFRILANEWPAVKLHLETLLHKH